MRHHLIVANQTLGGGDLERTVRERIEAGPCRFTVLVPMTDIRHESGSWTGGYLGAEIITVTQFEEAQRAMEADARRREEELAEARSRAERRLDLMLDAIRAAGGTADGYVGDADPVIAVKTALQEQDVDEVIVSTLPARLSRWLKMDLPSRISRMSEVPVTTIEASE
jgi:hypothetical protein